MLQDNYLIEEIRCIIRENNIIEYLPAGDHTDLYDRAIWMILFQDGVYKTFEVHETGEFEHKDKQFTNLKDAYDYIKPLVDSFTWLLTPPKAKDWY